MSDIGPGDWVVAVHDVTPSDMPGQRLVGGALYQVAVVDRTPRARHHCQMRAGVTLVGQAPMENPQRGQRFWCLCHFRLWPPPADEELRSEGVDADEEQPSKHPAEEPA